jgi:hypothetical protein
VGGGGGSSQAALQQQLELGYSSTSTVIVPGPPAACLIFSGQCLDPKILTKKIPVALFVVIW